MEVDADGDMEVTAGGDEERARRVVEGPICRRGHKRSCRRWQKIEGFGISLVKAYASLGDKADGGEGD